jgi:hypothetical protein
MVSIAILKLNEEELYRLDMDEVIDYFDKFKDEENVDPKYKLLKPYEVIISEAIKVGNSIITNAKVNELFREYDDSNENAEEEGGG